MDLGIIRNHPKTVLKDLSLIANGVMELSPNTPFWILLANFTDVPVRLPKNITVGIVLPFSRAMLLSGDDKLDTAEPKKTAIESEITPATD